MREHVRKVAHHALAGPGIEHERAGPGLAADQARAKSIYAAILAEFERTRDLLLPRLLSGQIDVEALPEPVLSEV